jgi:F-type H+-transporting ATPase subunit delta
MATVANIYARALADVVMGSHLDPGKTVQETRAVAALVASSKDLREVWETPSIPADQKIRVLDAIVAQQGFSKPVRNFIAVLIDHRRVHFLGPIVAQFEKELSSRLGFSEAEITSARELNPEERQTLESQIEKLTGNRVLARYSKDASILGGAIVKIGSTIYDGSVQGQLQRIRESITAMG